jgi:hypothetical protein
VIPYYTMPPVRKSAIKGEAAVVTTWAPGFDVERVFADEASAVIQGLPSLEDTDRAFFEMQTAGPVAMEAVGDEGAAPGKVTGSNPPCPVLDKATPTVFLLHLMVSMALETIVPGDMSFLQTKRTVGGVEGVAVRL